MMTEIPAVTGEIRPRPRGLVHRLRNLLGLPMRAGDSWTEGDGSTLTYLGMASDPWLDRVCTVCGAPATEFKTRPPWPGSTYSHTAMTCDTHASYLDGVSWQRIGNGEWREGTADRGTCATCHAPYGECAHTAHYAAMIASQEASAVRGRVAASGSPGGAS